MIRTWLLQSLVLTSACMAWGGDGHRIVGEIAYRHLTPSAKNGVDDFLDGGSLAQACTWADRIRHDPAYRWARPLHYVNIDPDATAFDMNRDCAPRGCVVSAIQKYGDILSDSAALRTARIEALKFLAHFVGDIHQPLHVGRARDRGGNDIRVSFFHNMTNLHRLWDSGMIRRAHKNWRETAILLDHEITPLQIIDWTCTDVTIWANESHRLCYAYAYDIPKSGELAEDYFDRCMPVVDRQLAKAGIRLAHMLNKVFVDESTGSVDKPKQNEETPTDSTTRPVEPQSAPEP